MYFLLSGPTLPAVLNAFLRLDWPWNKEATYFAHRFQIIRWCLCAGSTSNSNSGRTFCSIMELVWNIIDGRVPIMLIPNTGGNSTRTESTRNFMSDMTTHEADSWAASSWALGVSFLRISLNLHWLEHVTCVVWLPGKDVYVCLCLCVSERLRDRMLFCRF